MPVGIPLEKNESGRWPGDPAFWSIIFGDLMVFGAVFNVFMWDRSQNVAVFNNGSRHLNEMTGIIFTLLMLVSSWFVVKALHYARSNHVQASARMIVLALICGLAFCVIKVIDYNGKINSGFNPGTDLFYLYYFAVSGIHLLHVTVAMGAMIAVLFSFRGISDITSDKKFLESVSIFWHLTDFLWVMIFALLYLVR